MGWHGLWWCALLASISSGLGELLFGGGLALVWIGCCIVDLVYFGV